MAARVLVNTGRGKGKTTAALGTAIRALGQGQKVCVFQFMKGSLPTGEIAVLQRLGISVQRLGTGFSWTKESWDEDRELAARGWEQARTALMSGEWDLVVLDEINYVLGYGLLNPEEVARAIRERPAKVNVILTGRGLEPAIAEVADTITEMVPLKHGFDAGIKASQGIEF
jgi:cob(I)alamin adenosyltransferase